MLCFTTSSTFVSENSALGAKLIVAARSQGEVRLKRWFDDSITTLSMLGFCSIMLRTWLFCGQCADVETVVLTNRICLCLGLRSPILIRWACYRSVQGNLWGHNLSNSLRDSPTSAYNGVPTPGPLITHGLVLLSLNTAWVNR